MDSRTAAAGEVLRVSGRRRRRCWRVGFAHPAVRRRRKYRLYLGTEMKLSARTRNRQIFVAGMVLEHGYGGGAEMRGAILDDFHRTRPQVVRYRPVEHHKVVHLLSASPHILSTTAAPTVLVDMPGYPRHQGGDLVGHLIHRR